MVLYVLGVNPSDRINGLAFVWPVVDERNKLVKFQMRQPRKTTQTENVTV